jgi:hypothetical protein
MLIAQRHQSHFDDFPASSSRELLKIATLKP